MAPPACRLTSINLCALSHSFNLISDVKHSNTLLTLAGGIGRGVNVFQYMCSGRWETYQHEAVEAEIRKSEQRLLQLTSHLDPSIVAMDGRALF